MERPVVVVVGTRPEAIKLLLLHKELQMAGFTSILVSTDQHDELLGQVFDIFNIQPDINLGVMIQNQDLFHVTNSILEKMKLVYSELNPRLVVIQGDTTTAFASALAAYYLKIRIAHVEAGLRTGNIFAPYPEEINRIYISQIADYNFAPTHLSYANLLSSGIDRSKIFLTGNTVVDALFWIRDKIFSGNISIDQSLCDKIEQAKASCKKIVTLTAHRRESFDGGLLRIFRCIKKFVDSRQDIVFFYPAHPNPNIQRALLNSGLSESSNVVITNPILYKDLVYLLWNSYFIVTDSGGIQEEAMSLGKRVIILREVTERLEGVWEGLGAVVGTNETLLMKTLKEFCDNQSTDKPSTVYGDGRAASKIAQIIKTNLLDVEKINYEVLGSKRIIDIFKKI